MKLHAKIIVFIDKREMNVSEFQLVRFNCQTLDSLGTFQSFITLSSEDASSAGGQSWTVDWFSFPDIIVIFCGPCLQTNSGVCINPTAIYIFELFQINKPLNIHVLDSL